MLEWVADTLMAVVTYVPALIVDRESPTFDLIRAMFGMILIAFIVYVIAMMPPLSAIAASVKKGFRLLVRK